MKLFFLSIFLCGNVFAGQGYYGITTSTDTGTSVLNISGRIYVSESSSTANTPTITLHGKNKRITVRDGAHVTTITAYGFIGDGSQLTNVVHSTDALVNDVNELKLSTGSLDVRIYNLGVSTQNLDYNKVPYEGARTDIDMGTYSIVSIGRIGTGYKVQPLSDGSEVVYENSNPLYPLDVYGNVLIKDGGLLFSSSTITIDDTGIEYPNFSDISEDCLYDNTVGLVSDDGNYFKVYGENGCALYVKIGRAFGGLGVPTNSSITGIKAYLEGYTNNIDSTSITQARLKTYPGTYYGESKHNDFSLTSNNTLFIAGDDTDDWQGNLTPDIVNTGGTPTGFGWEIKLEFTGSATVYIDYMAIQGFYTNAGFFRIKKHSDEVNFSVNGSSYIIINDAGEYLLNIDGDLNITGDYYQNGSLFSGAGGGGDNLGNHIATTTLDMSNYDIANANHITASSVTATTFYGDLIGNADTASAFDHDPSACASGDFVTDISADGTLTCATPSGSGGVDETADYNWTGVHTFNSSTTVNNILTASRYDIDGSTFVAKLQGAGSIAVGTYAGNNNTAGNYNSFLGYGAGYSNTTGNNNSFLGTYAGRSNTSGSGNSFLGSNAGYSNITGSGNSIVGYQAGLGTYGYSYSSSTIMGYQAGYSLTSGSDNVLLGYQAGDSITTGSNNIIIGYDADVPYPSTSNYLNIGDLIVGDMSASSATVKGDLYANNYYGNISNTTGINADIQTSFDNVATDTTTIANNVSSNDTDIADLYANKVDLTETSSVTFQNSEFSVGGSTLVVSNGNVGIGTTNPMANLDNGGYTANGAIRTIFARQIEGDNIGNGTFLGVTAWETQFSSYNGLSFAIQHNFYGDVNSAINFYRGWSTTGGYLTFTTNNNTERMRIDPSGNVGIGTTSPAYKLDVDGGGHFTSSMTVDGGYYGDGTNITNVVHLTETSSVTFQNSEFSVGGSTFVVSGGKVGISSTTPTHTLSVEGDINLSGTLYRNGSPLAGTGDAVLAATQTWTGINTYEGNSIFNSSVTINADSSQEYALTIDSNSNTSDGYVVSISTKGSFTATQPYFYAKKITDQSVGTSYTKIQWDSILEDNYGGWDSSNYRYIVKENGIYQINVNGVIAQIGNATVTDVFLSLYVNGSLVIESNVSKTLGYGGLTNSLFISLRLKKDDYIEIYGKTNAGSPYFRNAYNWFTITKLH